MEEIKKVYRESVKENLLELDKILNDIEIDNPKIRETVAEVLNKANEKILSKWDSGEKYVRTLFVKMAFPSYPKELLKISICIDATINILDDLLDEKLDSNVKALYIVELIRNLATHNAQNLKIEMREKISEYFNKIILIAIAEDIYRNLVKQQTDITKIKEYAIQIYDCRSLDMDIYVELPLLKIRKKNKDEDLYKVIKIARIFRALNLIKKDLKDIRHDLEQDNETIVTISKQKKYLHILIPSLADHYLDLVSNISSRRDELGEIIINFKEMAYDEKNKIEEILQKSL